MQAVHGAAQVSHTFVQPTTAKVDRPLQQTQPAAQQQGESQKASLQLEREAGQGIVLDTLA